MKIYALLLASLLAVGLSMDTFAVAVCKGLATGERKLAPALTVGAYVAPGQQRVVGLVAIAAVLLLDLRGVTRTAAERGSA